jgi:hypothetical protein
MSTQENALDTKEHEQMPPRRTTRTPEPATAIRAELGAYGLWLEVEHTPGTWQGVYLPTRTVRRLVATLLADRQQTLARLDPPTWRRARGRERGWAERAGSGARIALGE